jgi:hypothetical protein
MVILCKGGGHCSERDSYSQFDTKTIPENAETRSGSGFVFGIPIEMIVQVFHRILDLKHGPGFLSGAHFF